VGDTTGTTAAVITSAAAHFGHMDINHMGIIITAESIAVTVDFSAADLRRLSFEE
jgi:hypothetical protein